VQEFLFLSSLHPSFCFPADQNFPLSIFSNLETQNSPLQSTLSLSIYISPPLPLLLSLSSLACGWQQQTLQLGGAQGHGGARGGRRPELREEQGEWGPFIELIFFCVCEIFSWWFESCLGFWFGFLLITIRSSSSCIKSYLGILCDGWGCSWDLSLNWKV